ncbi:MAG: hypothetical protein CBC13_09725 [Planctomycetia bacterium TMED53]|nr:MAG: hypothetical protein CBC13_09725 [Planctomycetia bacterium TMED53]
MRSIIIAVVLAFISVLAFMIWGDSAISSRVSDLEGKQASNDQNFETIRIAQGAMDDSLKKNVELIEKNSSKIEENRALHDTLSGKFEETSQAHSDRLDQQNESHRELLERIEELQQAKAKLAEELKSTESAGKSAEEARLVLGSKIERLESMLDTLKSTLGDSRVEDASAIEAMKQRIRDLEQQVRSSGQDRIDLVLRQGQMQKLIEELLDSHDALRQEVEILKSPPTP